MIDDSVNLSMENERADAGRDWPNSSHETKFLGANGDNHTRFTIISTLLKVVLIHKYIHTVQNFSNTLKVIPAQYVSMQNVLPHPSKLIPGT